MIMLGHANILG